MNIHSDHSYTVPAHIQQPLVYQDHFKYTATTHIQWPLYTATTHIQWPLIYSDKSYTVTSHIQCLLIYSACSYTATTHIQRPHIYSDHSYIATTQCHMGYRTAYFLRDRKQHCPIPHDLQKSRQIWHTKLPKRSWQTLSHVANTLQ